MVAIMKWNVVVLALSQLSNSMVYAKLPDITAAEILKTWEDNYAHFESMKVSYTERVLETVPPVDDPNRFNGLVRLMHVERVEQGQRFHVRYSCDEGGFNKLDGIIEGAFDGKITREYTASQKSGMIITGMIGRNTELMNHLKTYMLLDRPRLVRKNPSGPFDIYLIEDTDSKPLLSRILSLAIANSRVSVLPNIEPCAGQMCHVLEIYNKNGQALKLWFAHDKGMLLIKKQHYENEEPVIDIKVEQIGFVKTDGGMVWYPKKAYRITGNENLGKIKYELTTHEFVPNIQIDENTFRFDFPPGTDITDVNSRRSYKWQKGMKFILDEWNNSICYIPKDWSIIVAVGKPLPIFEDIKFNLSTEQTNDRPILLCFFDMNQRPSRNCLLQLNKIAKEFTSKDIAVIAIQSSKVDEEKLNDWVKNNNVPFPIGMIQADEDKTRFTWGVRSLPWLILTDKKHTVRAEGFSFNELDMRITKLTEE